MAGKTFVNGAVLTDTDINTYLANPNASSKNRAINGNFSVWQRGTSFSNPSGTFTADRWYAAGAETGSVISQQAFSPGNAITGYEPTYYLRFIKGGTTANLMYLSNKIEDVRTFAGQTITISYWMKASTTLTNEPLIQQNFGTGGSSEVYTTTATHTVTTSWARYSVTIAVPSITGKTIGAGSYIAVWPIRYVGTTNVTIEIWGVQVEEGTVATPFEYEDYATTLRRCQRYFYLHVSGIGLAIGVGSYVETTQVRAYVQFPVTMRQTPILVAATGTSYYALYRSVTDILSSPSLQNAGPTVATVAFAGSGTVGVSGMAYTNNAASSIAFSAEL